jgi:hypothetical protein
MEEVPGKALILGHAIAASGTLRRQAPRLDVHEPPLSVFFVIYVDILHEPFQVISQQLLREHTRGSTSSTVVWSPVKLYAVHPGATRRYGLPCCGCRTHKELAGFLRIQAAPRQGDNVVELKVLRSATMLVLATVVVKDVLSNL